LKRFPSKQNNLVLREASGAFQLNSQLAKWDPDQSLYLPKLLRPQPRWRGYLERISEVSNEVAYWELRSMGSFRTCRWQGPME
jgi:hypothetical protein